ncbi:hypothetical protein R69746_05793 [Paraburkholderia aspalathi]|uniref:helix-turn-helix domain-containing protein n=1 Tax=Paraburkholderia aspalathi TaxID=1324617 RepID=UPI00190C8D44|nr:helix-turn-helix transcriptional regulator [Paraburkholderia aspalathi]MBK3841849.1 helix-turn-helix transcriptional regulator [Paraburkholderia aspalathi]CAE6814964.1 hypothetical protein R69746_05793 [Paraburkholderia aspalathi]
MKPKRANEILAENIRRLMDGHPTLSRQTALAHKAGIAQSSIQRVLSAAVHPQLDVIESIATALRVTVAELLAENPGNARAPAELQPSRYEELPDADKEKIDSYIRFLIDERGRAAGRTDGDRDLVRLTNLRDLSEEQLAHVMRAALRELNDNTLASHDIQHPETKSNKRRTGNRN